MTSLKIAPLFLAVFSRIPRGFLFLQASFASDEPVGCNWFLSYFAKDSVSVVSSREDNLLGYIPFMKTFLEYQCSLQFLPAAEGLQECETLREFISATVLT